MVIAEKENTDQFEFDYEDSKTVEGRGELRADRVSNVLRRVQLVGQVDVSLTAALIKPAAVDRRVLCFRHGDSVRRSSAATIARSGH